MTQIGLMIEGQWGLTWARWQRLLETAEDLGFQSVFRSDHYTIGPPDDNSLETFISLTYAADNTRYIEFGPLVAPTTFRHPALTARMAAQINDLSEGRFVIGLGTGWHEREHRQFGIHFPDLSTRYEMLEDALNITRKLFSSDEPVTYEGKHYSLHEAVLLPRPSRLGGPPILVGGNGKNKTLPLVAKYADEWNGVYIDVDGYRERMDLLDGYLEKEGRASSDVKRSLMTQVIFGKDDATVKRKLAAMKQPADELLASSRIIGTPQQVIDQLGRYVEVGCERFMLMWNEQDNLVDLELLADTVLPVFHEA